MNRSLSTHIHGTSSSADEENGTRKELYQQKKAYDSNPELREKRKNQYEHEMATKNQGY